MKNYERRTCMFVYVYFNHDNGKLFETYIIVLDMMAKDKVIIKIIRTRGRNDNISIICLFIYMRSSYNSDM